MREWLKPLLFAEEEPAGADELRCAPRLLAAPAGRSSGARAKERSKRTAEELAAMSFRGLLSHLASPMRNHLRLGEERVLEFQQLSVPTALQQRVFDLAGTKP